MKKKTHSPSNVPSEVETVAEATWQEVESFILCHTPHLSVRQTLHSSPLRPKGRPWVIVHRKPAVVIIPRTPEGRFLLIRQERPPVQAMICEFPAGQVEGVVGEEDLEAAARRELREETGMICPGPLQKLGSFFSSPGFTDEQQTIFLAEGVEVADPVALGDPSGADEAIDGVILLTGKELIEWVRAGLVRDGNTLAGFAQLMANGKL